MLTHTHTHLFLIIPIHPSLAFPFHKRQHFSSFLKITCIRNLRRTSIPPTRRIRRPHKRPISKQSRIRLHLPPTTIKATNPTTDTKPTKLIKRRIHIMIILDVRIPCFLYQAISANWKKTMAHFLPPAPTKMEWRKERKKT